MKDRRGQDLFAAVSEFHEKFRLRPAADRGRLPVDLEAFRIMFLEEELQEYREACAFDDMELALDALVDLVYVALGTAYFHGFDFNEAFRRVHAANMTKERAKTDGDSKRGSSYDVVKPKGWREADLSDLVR